MQLATLTLKHGWKNWMKLDIIKNKRNGVKLDTIILINEQNDLFQVHTYQDSYDPTIQ